MGTLRENSSSSVNFFFLVDIFTCTLGIMILVTMSLALQPPARPDLVPPEKAGDFIVLKPGEDPPWMQLSKLLHRLVDLNETNAELAARRDWARNLPELGLLTNRYGQLKLTNTFMVARTNALARETAGTAAVIDRFLMETGLTNASDRIARLSNVLTNTALEIQRFEETNLWLQGEIDSARRHPRMVRVLKTDKPPILVGVSRGEVKLELYGAPQKQMILPAPVDDDAFLDALGRFRKDTNYTVFFVHPSGIAGYVHLAELTKKAGFQIGSDAMEEHGSLPVARKD